MCVGVSENVKISNVWISFSCALKEKKKNCVVILKLAHLCVMFPLSEYL